MRVVIVGNGPAGVEAARLLSREHEVVLVEKETVSHYSKPMLSHFIAGLVEEKRLFPYSPEWYERNGINLLLGIEARRVDTSKKILNTDGGEFPYDVLILATGARPRLPPVEGKEHFLTLRTFEDAERIKKLLDTEGEMIVVGGGFIGLELAGNLAKRGYKVTVVEKEKGVLGLDEELTERIVNVLREAGVEVLLGTSVLKATEDTLLTDRGELKGRLKVCAIGIEPEVSLAKASGIETRRGIVVNRRFETSAKDVYAIGDCAEYNGIICGTAKAAMEHAKVLVNILNGIPDRYLFERRSSIFKFGDFPIAIVGVPRGRGVWLDRETKAFYDGEDVVGVVVLGDMKKAQEWVHHFLEAPPPPEEPPPNPPDPPR